MPPELLDQVHDGVIATDLDGVIHTWNASAERMYGYTAKEMIGQSVSLLYFPEDREVFESNRAVVQQRGVEVTELRIRRKDGAEIFIDLRLSLQHDAAGRPVGMIGCSNDVTARRHALRDELRQREELRVILDSVPALVWYKDRDNRILRANLAAAASAGLAPAAMEGLSTYDLVPEEAAKYHRDDLGVIKSGRPKLGIIETMRTASGEQRWLRTDKVPYRDEHGAIVGVIVFAVDITDQKRAEQALEQARDTLERRVRERTAALAEAIEHLRSEVAQRQQAEERLELALWATGLGMWHWDARTRRADCDAHWGEMLGYRPEEIASPVDLWPAITHPDDQPAITRAWHAHVGEEGTPYFEVEHRLRTKSGEYRWIQTRGKVVERGPRGEALRMAGTNLDITDRKAIEEQAARHQTELAHILRLETVNCLAAELAHEINQPLGAIANYANGLAERLRKGQIDPAAMLAAAAHIGAQALRAGTVLQRLRAFVRKDTPPQELVDLNQLVESAAALVEPEARRQGISLALQLGRGLPPVRADAIQIEQVIVNLLRNGLEAIADSGGGRGELTVTTRGGAGEVEVRVHDSGGGVPAAARERLFEPFFTTKPEGLGMGLSISRSIVEAHGGRIWVDPTDGTGATFSFTLPV
ncbi:MAG TPA: PAS domain S-box protein [Candidatus Dormibacteraeota bacterium]|nr:PAS domain S-box protein [Candidatus Dormibacteraeota bacterium]